MKSIRRSLNNNGSNSSLPAQSPPLPGMNPLSRPTEKVAPPQKVIKALISHRSTNPQELSYTAGDFWYVTGERDGWYEALNPITGSRGLVPKSDFDEFAKGGRQTRPPSTDPAGLPGSRPPTSSGITSASMSPPLTRSATSSTIPKKQKQPVYAIVQYDFEAERPDELNAKKGEPIVVIAQSNHEWFVAKPIGRLGGPGLIPVAFVEIRDPATGRPIELSPDSIPMVDEWKKATADYKAAAIPLGKFDFDGAEPVSDSPYTPQSNGMAASQTSLPRSMSSSSVSRPVNGSHQQPVYRPEHDALLPPGELTALGVPSFHNESGNYWFRLQVTYVPDEPSSTAYTLSLYRTYEDFYDFQISLLDTFPVEAGRSGAGEDDDAGPDRILPYMPGPVDDPIDDELTEYRREELDAYVKALVNLRVIKAGYVLHHELFRSFFAAKYGDYCEECARGDAMGELEEQLAELKVSGQTSIANSSYAADRSTSALSHRSQHSQPGMTGQSSQMYNSATTHATSSRGPSPPPPIDTNVGSSRPASNHYFAGGRGQSATTSPGGYHGASDQSQPPSASPWSAPQSVTPAPALGQPPFVKIKIYDRATDDLIAIRVHPNVSHAELFDKVKARLGPEVNVLRYRVSMGSANGMNGGAQGYRELRDDRELREWMRAEDQKLVLYAEQQ